ncbi:hypothetical protein V498_03032 [Pseudogymnoascus sp. VKM F-4517 (FW-2822)]|nr:hypothetical protein V498_03032 [Pseudogymnoascus sp. VKM F-4517 (FW-2822)]
MDPWQLPSGVECPGSPAQGALALSQEQQAIVSSDAAKTRKRAFRACDICRRKRVKCDGTFPCSRCKMHEWTCTNGQAVKRVGLAVAKPATPQQPDAVYTCDAQLENSHTTSQDTNASIWVNCSRRATAYLNTNPGLYAKYSGFATGAFQSGHFHSGTALLNGLWDSKIQRNANQDANQNFGPFCIQQGDNKPITIGDQITIHYIVFNVPEFKTHFSTYDTDKGSLAGLAQLGSKGLWMFSAVLGQQLGGKFLCRKGSGINSDWYLVEIVTVNGKRSNSTVNRRQGIEWYREQEQHSEATAGQATTSMNGNALILAIQDKLQISSTLGSSGVNGTIGTSTPGEALPNECNSHSMRPLCSADSESKIGSEDIGSESVGDTGAGAGAGASTGASTTDGDSKRRLAPKRAAQKPFSKKNITGVMKSVTGMGLRQ